MSLTPNLLLRMQSTVNFPPGLFSAGDGYMQRRWKQVQHIANNFWSRFKKEYLPLLNPRSKWQQQHRSLSPEDIVLVIDMSEPRNNWCLGRISEVFKSKDGLVRSAEVIIEGNQRLKRPIHKLVLLNENN